MSRRWVKTYATLLDSSVYGEPSTTRTLWEVMRLEADRRGEVHHNAATLARRANLTTDEVLAGLRFLSAPDPASRDRDHDGRHIEEIPGGWRIMNHDKHQSGTSEEQKEFARIRSQRYRDRKRNASRVTRHASHAVTRDEDNETFPKSRVTVTTQDLDINQKLLSPSRENVTPSEGQSVTRDAREAMHLERIRRLLDEGESGSPDESDKRDEQQRSAPEVLQ